MSIRRCMIFLVVFISLVAGCTPQQPVNTPTATLAATATLAKPTITDTPPAPIASQTPSTPLATPTQKIRHMATPSDPADHFESQIIDPDSSAYANSKRVVAGDNFDAGSYERPFNSGSMDKYSPDLDILQAGLSRSGNWVYVTIKLASVPRGSLLSGSYGVEIDIDLDGRGDVLVVAQKLGIMWSVENVSVWRDANQDVGGAIPLKSDLAKNGDGYEQKIFDSGTGYDTDAAWARIDPGDFSSIQIAFKKSIIDNDKAFMWNAWAEDVISPGLFDYNDHFTLSEAGSPLTTQNQAYPLKDLANVDNTCRWVVGFEPTGTKPGLCPLIIDRVPGASDAMIHGLVWYDRNANFYQDPGEPGFENMTLNLNEGACGSEGKVIAAVQTTIDGTYELKGIAPGQYCLSVIGPIPTGVSPVTGSGPQTVSLKAGKDVKVNFPYVIYSR